jgi:hypothetical protein
MEANKHSQHATARKLRFVCGVTARKLLFVYGVRFALLIGSGAIFLNVCYEEF